MSLCTQSFRSALSLYPTGVAVVSAEPEGYLPFGMTINSFTSLSLTPPLIMWNLQKSSETFKAWHNVKSFTVNFLREDQQEVSTRYARKGEHDMDEESFRQGITDCPMLIDCMANLECTMHARHEEGDHVIIIGEVVNMMTDSDQAPLVFHKGKYKILPAVSNE